jgi:hypothetical protein
MRFGLKPDRPVTVTGCRLCFKPDRVRFEFFCRSVVFETDLRLALEAWPAGLEVDRARPYSKPNCGRRTFTPLSVCSGGGLVRNRTSWVSKGGRA